MRLIQGKVIPVRIGEQFFQGFSLRKDPAANDLVGQVLLNEAANPLLTDWQIFLLDIVDTQVLSFGVDVRFYLTRPPYFIS